AALGLGALALALLAGYLGDLGHEVAHVADLLLRFLFAGGLDGVADLAAGGVHRLELERRHARLPKLSALGSQLSAVFGGGGRWGRPGGVMNSGRTKEKGRPRQRPAGPRKKPANS